MPKSVLLLLAVLALGGCASHHATAKGDVVRIAITDSGFEPANATLPAGRPVTVEFTRKTDQTCATEVVFGSSGERHALPLQQTVRIPVTAAAGDTLRFACGMDMYRGTLVAR